MALQDLDINHYRRLLIQKPRKLLEDQISAAHEFVSTNDFILHIRRLLWNEIEMAGDIDSIFYTLASVAAYKEKLLDIVDLKVLINLLESELLIDTQDRLTILYFLTDKEYIQLSEWLQYVEEYYYDYGVANLAYHEIVNFFFDKIQVDATDELKNNEIMSKSITLEKRPEYVDEVLKTSTTEELTELVKWTTRNVRTAIVEDIISRTKNSQNEYSYKQIVTELDQFTPSFPFSPNVFGDFISNYEPQTVEHSAIEDLVFDVREWLPKFVYSKPELHERIKLYFLGGRNIGHSAIVIKTNYTSFLLDYGMSVVNNGIAQWSPLLEKLDFVLISHAHMDHSGALPLLYNRKQSIPWLGLEQTRLMTEMLWMDTSNIMTRRNSPERISSNPFLQSLSDKGVIVNALNHFKKIETEKEYTVGPNVKITAYDAAHLFGSCGFEIDIAGKRLLYTGDFNQDKGASFPTDTDITIFDGTNFEKYHKYPEAKVGLTNVLANSDRVLIPAFSMGRSQEILFQLKQLNAEKKWKIYLTGMGGRLASKLNISVGSSGGGKKSGISIVPTVEPEDFIDKSIVIAGQGMLQVGTSRRLLDYTKDDPKTSVVLCGYQAPNTMGYHLSQNHSELLKMYKQQVIRVKISGHTFGDTLDKFLDERPNGKMMVHSPIDAYENRKRSDIDVPPKLKAYNLKS